MKENLRLLEDRALGSPGWLPEESDLHGLGALRAEHQRLLRTRQDAAAQMRGLARQYESEDEAHAAALAHAASVDLPPPPRAGTSQQKRETALREATAWHAAASEALADFLATTLAALRHDAETLYAHLDQRHQRAADRRTEAERLFAEADRAVREARRTTHWLDRVTGRSHLGHYPHDDFVVADADQPYTPTGHHGAIHA